MSAPLAQAVGCPPPGQIVDIEVHTLTVLGDNGNFRTIDTPLNPTDRAPPFFQVWDKAFLDIIDSDSSVQLISEKKDFAFAHEAPIWNPKTDEVFFASNAGGTLGRSDLHHNNQVSKICLKDVQGTGPQNIPFTKVPISPELQMVNGGTPYKDKLLFVNSGRENSPPGLALVDPKSFKSETILDNFYGRQFNSLNDAKVHPKTNAIFFTDVFYGFVNDFRPPPLLPNQVYRFDLKTSELRVVADGFDKCNGIAFSPCGSIAYIADSGASVKGGHDPTKVSTIYAFDLDKTSQTFLNRRVVAYVDSGVPDGLQVDSKGNIYAGCGDGVQVFNPHGLLLGKIFIGGTSPQLVFAGPGRMVILAETNVFLVKFKAEPSIVELKGGGDC